MTVKGVTLITHPLVQHNLTRLRDHRTGPQEFRRVLGEVAALMLYEATRSFGVEPVGVKTPLGPARGFQLRREVVLVPVLAILFLVVKHAGLSEVNPDLYAYVQAVCFLNLGLLLFNLLPIYPLDGGQILRSLLWFIFFAARPPTTGNRRSQRNPVDRDRRLGPCGSGRSRSRPAGCSHPCRR